MDIFDFLNGLSPWWWVAIALVLGMIEMLSFSFFLIGPALAALVVAVLLWIVPDMTGAVQVLIFAVFSVGLTLAGRSMWVNRSPGVGASELNNRSAQLVGRNAVVIDGFAAGKMGNVEVDGIRWRAQLDEAMGATAPAPGDVLRITAARGMTLVVSDQN